MNRADTCHQAYNLIGTDTASGIGKLLEMQKRIVVTVNDYSRIVGMIELASSKSKMPQTVSRLYEKLLSARMLPPETINGGVITMNSRVLLKSLNTSRESEITITYPREAQPAERKVSVFSEIGVTLLGRQEKDIVSWTVPGGPGLFEIVKVTYQPEAAGDFNL
jgi:regulator of nucleoside diphosphate kinase